MLLSSKPWSSAVIPRALQAYTPLMGHQRSGKITCLHGSDGHLTEKLKAGKVQVSKQLAPGKLHLNGYAKLANQSSAHNVTLIVHRFTASYAQNHHFQKTAQDLRSLTRMLEELFRKIQHNNVLPTL